MSNFLGIDTSNYTTSAAIYNSNERLFSQSKMLLPVKKGEKGLRQSDAVFHHTVQLPSVIKNLFENGSMPLKAIGVSASPRDSLGSYMPCFLVGISVAESMGAAFSLPVFQFSHQAGHIAAVVSSSKNEELFEKEFIAFHLSGGTTEVVLVKPDKNKVFSSEIIASSLDLKAGQAIDRTGVMLGLDFPCGVELDRLSRLSDRKFNIKASAVGNDCSLSGIENKTKDMFQKNESKEDIARFCIESVIASVDSMCRSAVKNYGNLPLVFSGGVSSNSLLREFFSEKYNAVFAEPSFSADNAAGIARLAAKKAEG